ncbi:MAG: hypothetical protein OEM82_11575, partial [Acidobacteriota bacterium]|nr:hypothetical protein [Acidobacteriota bacterium]
MKIRTAQINEIEKAREQDFVKEVAHEIRTQHADECKDLDDEALRAKVEDGFKQAKSYGLKQKYSLSMFVQLQFLSAPDFDEYPTVRYILTHPSVEPDDK